MAKQVEVNPGLNPAIEPGPHVQSISALVSRLTELLARMALRANDGIQRDGENRMAAPLGLASYAAVDLPAPADFPSSLVWVSDAPPGQNLQISDGATWSPV